MTSAEPARDISSAETGGGDAGKVAVLRPANLRYLAMLHYCYEAQGVSIAEMATQPPFNGVSRRTLENWSRADRWTERRRLAEEEWTRRVRERIGDELVQQRLAQIETLERIEKKALTIIESGELAFRSLEGAISALVRLAVVMDGLREKLLGSLPAGDTRATSPSSDYQVNLSFEEARAAASAVLKMRRDSGAPKPKAR